MRNLQVFSGNGNRQMAEEIAGKLGLKLGREGLRKFSDGEVFCQIEENVRGADVFIIQPTCPSVNENLIELLIMADAMKNSSAKRITAVMPYFGYARQDQKKAPRVPITAKLTAKLLETAGIGRALSMDLHSGQIQGFFDIPLDHLNSRTVFLPYLESRFTEKEKVVMVSPDAGGVERTRSFAKKFNTNLAIIDKNREKANEAQAMHVIGDVSGKTAILIDDMVDTAGTLCQGAKALVEHGAKEVYACCAHPVLSGPAVKRINESKIKNLFVTNTIPLGDKEKKCKKIEVVSASEHIAQAIRRIHNEESLSDLFI